MKRIKAFPDLLLVALLVLLTIIFVETPFLSTSFVRTILGLPFVLFYPGYSFIAALFPGKDDLDGIERLALSFGLSIAIVPLIGLALNFTPWGIVKPILPVLSLFILLCCFAAYHRRSKLPEENRFAVPFRSAFAALRAELSRETSRVDRALTVILIIAILASLVTFVYVIVTPKIGERFTEFYILGKSGKADGYPTSLSPNETGAVIVGIVNHEYVFTNYTMQLFMQGEVLLERDVALEHNATREELIEFNVKKSGKLEFLLYKEANFTAPYRSLHLWVNLTS